MVKLPNEEERLVIAAIGESGEGKSTLLNLLLASPGQTPDQVFPVSDEPEACTTQPRAVEGYWRGDLSRPVVVVDTPGVGCEEGLGQDVEHTLQTARLLQSLGHVSTFVIVLKSGQSRFLSQHQAMFDTFQKVYGEQFWRNAIIDVSHSCNVRNKRNFDSWMEKLGQRFPWAAGAKPPRVFIDAPTLENDTLEDFYTLCKGLDKISCCDFPASVKVEDSAENKHNNNFLATSMEDISFSLSTPLEERPMSSMEVPTRTFSRSSLYGSTGQLDLPSASPRPRSRLSSQTGGSLNHFATSLEDLSPSRATSRSSLYGSMSHISPRPPSRSELIVPATPYLPPRSPTLTTRSRRRTLPPSLATSRPPTSTSRVSRSFILSPTDDFSSSTYATLSKMPSISSYSTPRAGRSSFRETSSSPSRSWRDSSPSLRTVYSRETSPTVYSKSRDPSPDSGGNGSSSKFPTIGLPTYLRTSHAHKYPFTKAMRANRLLLSHATEDRILMEAAEPNIEPLPDHQVPDRIGRVTEGQDLQVLPTLNFHFDPQEEEIYHLAETQMHHVGQTLEQHFLYNIAHTEACVLEIDVVGLLAKEVSPEQSKARKTTEPKSELETFTPETMIARTPYNLVRKALLPKIKYHWDKGFKQGPGGWLKVPVVKMKLKYPEEDQDLLPPSLSVEGGRWCETRLIKLDGGKAKLKLKTCEGPGAGEGPLLLRVVPIDREGKQEVWVPEFLVTVERGAVPGEGEKWLKGIANPAMPE